MIIDVTYGGNRPWNVLVYSTKSVGQYSKFRPFFYVILDEKRSSSALHIIEKTGRDMLEAYIDKIGRRGKREIADTIRDYLDEYPKITETDMTPILYNPKTLRYERNRIYRVYRVETLVPQIVRTLADVLRNTYNIKCSGYNIRYPCRVVMSNIWLNTANIVPLYYDLDTDLLEKLSRIRYIVYDLEILERPISGIKYIISIYETDPTSQEDVRDILNNAVTIECRGDECRDDVEREFRRARLGVGFNNFGFDDKKLLELNLIGKTVLKMVDRIDLSIFIRNNAASLGIGTASMSLGMIVYSLRKELGLSRDVIEIKLRSGRMLKSLDTAVKYNLNDILITTRLSKPLLQIVFSVAGLVQIPPSMYAHHLKSGQVAEYAFVKFLENIGEVIEAREFNTTARIGDDTLEGTKVFTLRDVNTWVQAYAEEIEQIKKMVERGEPMDRVVKLLYTIADRVLKRLKRMEKTGRKDIEREVLNYIARGKIVWVDVNMMYPTEIVVEGVDPCAYIGGISEDARFSPRQFASPYHTFVSQLRSWREWAKKMKKMYEEEGDRARASSFDLLQKALKPIINASYGFLMKKSGPAHGAHYQAGLKIFHNTRRKLITLMLYAHARGWKPLYGDTDSLMLEVPQNQNEEHLYAELNRVANMLGYDLSLEGVMDYMYIRAKKNYIIGKFGEKCIVKGQPLSKLKHLFSPYIMALILDGLERGNIDETLRKIDEVGDPYMLIPSLARKVTDMFLLDVDALKRRIQDTRNRIRVKIGDVIGYLKELKNDLATRARLTAIGMTYGEKDSDDYLNVKLVGMSPHDILDLRVLPITSLERDSPERARLTARHFIVLVGEELVLASADSRTVSYVLYDPASKKIERVPAFSYVTLLRNMNARADRKLYHLVGLRMRVNVYRRDIMIEEVKDVVKRNLINWLIWSGLDRLVKASMVKRVEV